jgi:hypothetical protein
MKFEWPGINAATDARWDYYECAQSPADLVAFYKEEMIKPGFDWLDEAWVERPEGTLAVYYQTFDHRWLYLWFLADGSSASRSNLVIAEALGLPLDLPCH